MTVPGGPGGEGQGGPGGSGGQPPQGAKILVYAPDVQVYIATKSGVVDVSQDIVKGEVKRVQNGVSQAVVVLNNQNKQWTQNIKRMDRIVVFMTRTRRMQVFAGYVDSAPFYDLYPTTCTITASCTLKRLLYTYWDPGLNNSIQLLASASYQGADGSGGTGGGTGGGPGGGSAGGDSGIGAMLTNILVRVGGWDQNAIMVQNMPSEFLAFAEKTNPDPQAYRKAIEDMQKLLGLKGGGGLGSAPAPGTPGGMPTPPGQQGQGLGGLGDLLGGGAGGGLGGLLGGIGGGEAAPGQPGAAGAQQPGGTTGGGGAVPPYAFGLFNSMFKTAAFTNDLSYTLGLSEQTHEKALINDQQLMVMIQAVAKAGLRSFQSAPTGEFTAYYPDYFGIHGGAQTIKLEDIEMKNVSIQVSDAPLATHVFTVGDSRNIYGDTFASSPYLAYMQTQGFITVENQDVFKMMINTDGADQEDYTAEAIYRRFGARPLVMNMPMLKSPLMEKFQALYLFMQQWAKQYATKVEVTFMPEIMPNMRLELSGQDLTVYVQEVTHRFDRKLGFFTDVVIMAPSTRGGGLPGLPVNRSGAGTVPLSGPGGQ